MAGSLPRDAFKYLSTDEFFAPNEGMGSFAQSQVIADAGAIKDNSTTASLPGQSWYWNQTVTEGNWIDWSRSYFRVEFSYFHPDFPGSPTGRPLTRADGIAFCIDPFAAMISNIGLEINSVQIESIQNPGIQDIITTVGNTDKLWQETTGTGMGWQKYLSDPNFTPFRTLTPYDPNFPVSNEKINITFSNVANTIVSWATQNPAFPTHFTQDMVGGFLYVSSIDSLQDPGPPPGSLTGYPDPALGAVYQILTVAGPPGDTTSPQSGTFRMVGTGILPPGTQTGVSFYVQYQAQAPEADYNDRINQVINGQRVEVMWKPPIGLFNLSTPMKGSQVQIRLDFNPNMYAAMTESIGPKTLNTDYAIQIIQLDLWLFGSTPDPTVITGATHDTTMQEWDYTAATTQLLALNATPSQLTFTVDPSVFRTIVAFRLNARDGGATNGLSFSQFDTADLSVFQVQVPDMGKLVPNSAYNFVPNGILMGQVDRAYIDYILLNGGPMWDNKGGFVSVKDWQTLYPFFAIPLVRDSNQSVTKIIVKSEHSEAPAPNEYSVWVCGYYKAKLQIVMNAGGGWSTTFVKA